MIKIEIKKPTFINKYITQVTNYNKTIHLGFFSTATYANGTPVPVVARANNYGTLNSGGYIPPRPFLTSLPGKKRKDWAEYLNKVMIDQLERGATFTTALETAHNALAVQAVNDVKNSIEQWGDNPPNAPSTIKRKQKKPGQKTQVLFDTGHLWNSVSYLIE